MYQAYCQQVVEVGPALRLVKTLGAGRLWGMTEAEGASLTARLQIRQTMLDAMVQRWQQGQPGVVRWEQVEASGAVTDTFRDEVMVLVQAHADDPARFLAEVLALKGFRANKHEELRSHLQDIGVLPERDAASPEDLLQVALATMDRQNFDDDDIAWCQRLVGLVSESTSAERPLEDAR